MALDERVARGATGLVIVRTRTPDVVHAVCGHVARSAAASAVPCVVARPGPGATLWREVLRGVGDCGDGPGQQAGGVSIDALVEATGGRRVVVVAPMPPRESWDFGVAVDLAAQSRPFFVVFVAIGPVDVEGLDPRPEIVDVSSSLDAASRERWWALVARAGASDPRAPSLPELQAWWTRACREELPPEGEPDPLRGLSAEGLELLSGLALLGCPWPRAAVCSLEGGEGMVAPLVSRGLLSDDGGWLTVQDAVADALDRRGSSVAPVRARRLASALVARADADTWSEARAAELFLVAGDVDLAEGAVRRAMALAADGVARREVSARWGRAVAGCASDVRLGLQCRAVQKALEVGEGDDALSWARAAAATAPDDARVMALLGQALLAVGDVVAADVTLVRAQRHLLAIGDDAGVVQVSADLAEVARLQGDLPGARRQVTQLIASARALPGGHEVVLQARNTLGKILLAEARWEDAERHFAEDALDAATHGSVRAELRARMNRGVALLSRRALDEARAIFDAVRQQAEREGNVRASLLALDNLAVVATWRRDYLEAIRLYERTLDLWRRVGDRVTVAHVVGNLAELRRKLGLFEHAEHAIRFGRRAVGPGIPPERSAHFGVVAARVALDRRRPDVAQREIVAAIHDAGVAGHRRLLGEAHRVSTRIALEDGDLRSARASLRTARELSATDEARAEVALLDAWVGRAAGEDAEQLALAALDLARTAGEEERLREVHTLLCEMYRAQGELGLARSHLAQAVSLRDHLTTQLSAEVCAAFLERHDVARLAHLEAALVEAGAGAAAVHCPVAERPSSPSPSSDPLPRCGAPSGTLAPIVEIVGDDVGMRALRATIKKVARSTGTVLIRGESGTGKELVAAALHGGSDRAHGPMITVNCAALVETLLLSELFGHEKGAFTGAIGRKRGRFELADGGTLFLDEIGDISQGTQVALLRVLQEHTFERVGGTTPIRVDVRIVCATNRDLRAMVQRGEFREDLYYRLCGITIDVPALRARPGDLPCLVDHLLGRIAAERGEPKKYLSVSALSLLASHSWPGNVRELENALRVATLFAESPEVQPAHLLENVDGLRSRAERSGAGRIGHAAGGPPSDTLPVPAGDGAAEAPRSDGDAAADSGGEESVGLPDGEASATAAAYAQVRQGVLSLSDLKRQIERDCIARALAETKGNITRAAGLLGMKRPRLSQLVKQYGLSEATSEVA